MADDTAYYEFFYRILDQQRVQEWISCQFVEKKGKIQGWEEAD